MNISGTALAPGYSGHPSNAATGSARSSSFSDALTAATDRPSEQSEEGVTQPDFTHMTRKDLAEWVNSKIKNGEMSLDGSEAFVGMTIKIPVNGPYTGLDDTESVDFMQIAQSGIGWAVQHGDAAMLASLQTAIGTMQHYRGGKSGGIDLAA